MALVKLAAQALKEAGAKEIYLFGSLAEGRFREDSDVDIAISGLPAAIFFKTMSKVSDILGRPVDLVDLDDHTLFTEYLVRKGKLKRVA